MKKGKGFRNFRIKGYIEFIVSMLILISVAGGVFYLDREVNKENHTPKAAQEKNANEQIEGAKAANTKPSNTNPTNSNTTNSKPADEKSQEEKDTVIFSSTNPLNKAYGFLSKYGWRINSIINIQEITLPQRFDETPGELPLGLYWAYCNELSKAMGLDFAPYKGKKVKSYGIEVRDKNNSTSYVNLLIADGKIVGAWLMSGDVRSKTLDKRSFKDVVSMTWEKWLKESGTEDYNSSFNIETRKLSPEQIIRKYLECSNKKDFKGGFMLFSKYYQSEFLFNIAAADLTQGVKIDHITPPIFGMGTLSNVKVNEIEDSNFVIGYLDYNDVGREKMESKKFKVSLESKIDGQPTPFISQPSFYVMMVKENSQSPWKIEYISF